MPRPYPPEFWQRALDLVRSGRPVADAGLPGIREKRLLRARDEYIEPSSWPVTCPLGQ
jgi:hypothetical protein